MGEVFQAVLNFLAATDIIWGTLVGLYVIVALPIGVLIIKHRENKDKK